MSPRRRRWHEQAAQQQLASPDINTTPLIDVMLVLLVMLIITIPARLDSVDMRSARAAAAPPTPPVTVQLDIGPGERMLWNHAAVDSPQRLQQLMHDAAQATPPVELRVHADAHARYDAVARALATAQREGLTQIALDSGEAAR